MKRFTLTTIPLLCAALAPLCADAGNSKQTDAERHQMYMDEMNKITPSGEPEVYRYADPFITADFIWWKAQEDGLNYAFDGTTPTTTSTTRGRVRHPKFKYEPGFKVGFGLKFRHDGWDTFAQYTRLNFNRSATRRSASTSASGVSNLQSNIGMPYAGDIISFYTANANTSWALNFNVLDLELGRNFWVSKWLTLRPFVGLKLDWTNQKFRANYNDISAGGTDVTIAGSNVAMKMREHQFGVGIRSGLNTTWYMAKCWAIYGELAFSGLINDFKAKRRDNVTLLDGTTFTQNSFKSKNFTGVTAVIEWSLGLRYETAFHHDDYLFQLQAGWEEQIWFDQNQFLFVPNNGSSNLSFQGLTVKAAFYF